MAVLWMRTIQTRSSRCITFLYGALLFHTKFLREVRQRHTEGHLLAGHYVQIEARGWTGRPASLARPALGSRRTRLSYRGRPT